MPKSKQCIRLSQKEWLRVEKNYKKYIILLLLTWIRKAKDQTLKRIMKTVKKREG